MMALKAFSSSLKLINSPVRLKQITSSYFVTNQQRHYKVNAKRDLGIEKIEGLYRPVKEKTTSIYVQDVEWKEKAHASLHNNCYNALNFTIGGYDMVLVESYAKFVHRTMIRYKLDIVEIYGLPSFDTVIKHLGSRNTPLVNEMNTNYTLKTHQRVIRVNNLSTLIYPLLLQILMNYIPQSVNLSIAEHTHEDFKKRFMEKSELAEINKEMKELLRR